VTTADSLSGAAAGNYTLTQPIGLSANITPASLTVTGTSVANKVYDGTNAATLLGGTLSGVIGSDAVTLVQGGTFASVNAGSGIAVMAADSLTGAAAGNYVLAAQPTGLIANITPATLTYLASPDKAISGKAPTGLDGTVTGFVAGETLASATTGTLSWTTSATESSPVGKYDIDGSGLSATNYTFVQAASNATALTLAAAESAPIPAIASIESDILQSPGPNAPPTIDQTFERNGKARLVIENLGVKLPGNAISTH
jgi:YDG domain-containing protein/MBG domain-containing protein